MTRYRVLESPHPNGYFKIRGGYYLDQDVVCLPSKKVMTYDVVVPDFHRRSQNGEIFNNPFNSTTVENRDEGGYSGTILFPDGTPYRIYDHQRFMGVYDFGPDKFLPVELDVEDARAKCRIKALSNVTATQVDLGNFIAEWDQTRLLHKNLGHSLERFIREESLRYKRPSFKRVPLYDNKGRPILNRNGQPVYRFLHEPGKFIGKGLFGSKAKRLSDIYLAIRMGLVPLLSDLEGACKILGNNKALRRTARSLSSASGTANSVMSRGDPDRPEGWIFQLSHTRLVTFRNGLLYEASPAGLVMGQLGLTRPLSSLWQSMPWTFVADWFVGVGDWLDAIQPSGASKTLAAWDSYREVETFVMSVSDSYNVNNPDGSSINLAWNETFTQSVTTKSRVPWDGSCPPVPVPGTGFSTIRSADFAALVLQRIGSFI